MRLGCRNIVLILLLALTALLLPSLSMPLQAQQSQIDLKRNQIKELEQEIALINSQIASSTRQRKNTLNTLALIRKKVAARKRLISRLDSDLANQRRELQSHQESLARLERTLDTLKANYKHLILTAYKNRDTRKWFLYLFASESIEQGYRRWVYLKEYCNSINAQGEKILQLQQETQVARKRTQLLLSATQEKQRAYTKELTQYQKDEKESAALDAKLAKEQKRLKADLAKKRREASNLNKEVERMLAALIKQSNSANNKNTALKEQEIKLSNEFGANRGKLPWPLDRYVVVEEFGQHPHPVLKNVKLPFNNGINLSAANRSPVKAVFNGTVKQIIIIPGYSHCVLVQHGTYFTFYCKLGRVSVKVGEKISTGAVIGTLEEEILHFELWQGTTKQNPRNWLR